MTPAIITWAQVINIAPELATLPEPTQTAILAAVGRQVPANQWGSGQIGGQLQLAAHLGTLTRRRGDGPTASKTAGGLTQSFQPLMQFGELGLTSYGVEYSRLVRLLPAVAMGVVF